MTQNTKFKKKLTQTQLRKISIYNNINKNKIFRNKLNQGERLITETSKTLMKEKPTQVKGKTSHGHELEN